MALLLSVEHPETEYKPRPSTVTVRICRDCGKHYVGLLQSAAEREALQLTGKALTHPAGTEDSRNCFQEAFVIWSSCQGICRPCALTRWSRGR